MEKDEIIKKMQEMKNKREIEILENELKKNNSSKNLESHKVIDVKYLGQIEVAQDEELKGIYLIIEQQQDKNGNLVQVEKYYTEDFEFLGGNNRSDGFDFIMLNKEHMGDEELKKNLETLEKEGELDLEKVEKEELEEIAKALGIEEEDIENMSQMDLAQEIENSKDGEQKKTEEEELNEEQTKRLTGEQQEINLSTKVDNKSTLGQVLNLNTSEYTKVAIIYSERLNEVQNSENTSNTTRYSFVAVKKDGTAEVINDRLEIDPSSGNNSYKDAIKVDADQTARKDDKTLSRYKIVGKDDTLSVENSQYGEVKAYYGKGKTRNGNESVETQLETANVRPTSIEIRRLQADNKGTYNTDKMAEEANYHFEKENEDTIGINSVDGDENTIDHVHNDYAKEHLDEWAELIMEDDDVEMVFTNNEVKEMIEKYWDEDLGADKEYTLDDVEIEIGKIKERIEEDANNLNRQKGK